MDVAQMHYEWERKHLAEAPFKPETARRPDSDYNLHHLDVSATPEQDAEYFSTLIEMYGPRITGKGWQQHLDSLNDEQVAELLESPMYRSQGA